MQAMYSIGTPVYVANLASAVNAGNFYRSGGAVPVMLVQEKLHLQPSASVGPEFQATRDARSWKSIMKLNTSARRSRFPAERYTYGH